MIIKISNKTILGIIFGMLIGLMFTPVGCAMIEMRQYSNVTEVYFTGIVIGMAIVIMAWIGTSLED